MYCPKCNEKVDQDTTFCPSCGEKINEDDSKKCPNCSTLNDAKASFCNSCGYNFTNSLESKDNNISRTPELILGILAAVLGFFVSFIALFFSAFSESAAWVFVSLVFFSILGIVSTIFVKKYNDLGGIGMLVSGIFLLITGGTLGIISSILYIIGGLLALFRK